MRNLKPPLGEGLLNMKVYFDNAATTPVSPEVLEVMLPYFSNAFGNPSSIHAHGRETRAAIEKARKMIAGILNTSPSQIFFTSGGTESNNTALIGSVSTYGMKHVISSAIEHHAVLHTLQYLQKKGKIELHFVKLNSVGGLDIESLEELLKVYPGALVSLMHGNNEIGNLNDLNSIAEVCGRYNAVFHSDTVQTMGHFTHDLQKLTVDFIVGSAHKFHGSKGTGLLYVREGKKIGPYLHGGAQERNMRGGTENIAGIVGMAKALEIAYSSMESDRKYILSLKQAMMEMLKDQIENVNFNGLSSVADQSLYTVLSVVFPLTDVADMLLFNLDINKISASGGSACTSGSNIGSHVLNALYGPDDERPAVRFSFSKYNTLAEVEYVVQILKKIFAKASSL